MATRSASAASQGALSRRILVTIDRDMTCKTTKVIWQHEKLLYELVHGEGKVREVDHASLDEGYVSKPSPDLLPYNKKQDQISKPSDAVGLGFVFIGDPAQEYARLSEVFGRMVNENVLVVETAYGRFSEGKLERLLGKPTLNDLPPDQLRQVLDQYGAAPPAPLPTMTEAEKKEANDARRKFVAASKDELLAMCDASGVEI